MIKEKTPGKYWRKEDTGEVYPESELDQLFIDLLQDIIDLSDETQQSIASNISICNRQQADYPPGSSISSLRDSWNIWLKWIRNHVWQKGWSWKWVGGVLAPLPRLDYNTEKLLQILLYHDK